MRSIALLPLFPLLGAVIAQRATEWKFVQNGTSGIVALELITVSPNLMLMFDRADGNPLLLPDGQGAWAALWHLENNTATPLNAITDTFCAGGGFISNGSLVSIGGMELETEGVLPEDGRMGLRLFGPCTSPTGDGEDCTVYEDTENLHLVVTRWYPTGLRISDGSLMILGGSNWLTLWNTDEYAENSFEFFPSRPGEEGQVRPSKFLADTQPSNFFPRSFVLPSGHVFIISNNQTMVYDIETDTETRLPDLPNNVRICAPFDGTAQLLPLSPPLYEPTVLVCGGSAHPDPTPTGNHTSLDPSTDQCSRITLTPAGIAAGWEVEHMPDQRFMAETVILPTGDVLLINGAHNGYSGYPDPTIVNIGNTGSDASNPATRPVLYRTQLPAGQRFTQVGLPTSDIPRMYHSAASLTPLGNIMVAASNPHTTVVRPPTNISFPSEFRVEYLNPDFITNNSPRPVIHSAPKQILFNHKATLSVSIPASLHGGEIQVSLMDMGYVTHAQHQNSRLVFLEYTLNGNTLEITAPPNNYIYPPGPAWIYVTVNGVWSEGAYVMIGDGGNPPRPDQGVKINLNSV